MQRRAVHLVISGRVQGVGYRAWAEIEATALGLGGWVCNRRDGTVEAVVSGAPDRVEAFLKRAWDGPPSARVTAVDFDDTEPPAHEGFEVRPTA